MVRVVPDDSRPEGPTLQCRVARRTGTARKPNRVLKGRRTDITDSSHAARLQVVAYLTRRMLDNQIDQPEPFDLQLIKHLAEASNNKHYRQIMKAMQAGVEQGPGGINAAHLTANCIVGLAFKWTAEYVSALDRYKDKLRAIGDAKAMSAGTIISLDWYKDKLRQTGSVDNND